MKAVTAPLPTGTEWAYEVKWDGMRAIVVNGPEGAATHSSRLNDITARFPELQDLHARLGAVDVVLDGELVALGPDGLPSFSLLQRRMHLDSRHDIERRRSEVPVTFMLFDLLRLDATETLPLPLENRRRLLESLLEPGPSWQISTLHLEGGPELFEVVRDRGMEGVVAKRLASPYRPGQRSRDWVKVKPRRRQEFVVGGWVSGEGNRAGAIGGLVVGYYDRAGLRCAGRVGSGLTDLEVAELAPILGDLAIDVSPFVDPVPTVRGRTLHFVEPQLVVEVAFGEWTPDSNLRHPVYLGRRGDVDPAKVVREPDPAPDQTS